MAGRVRGIAGVSRSSPPAPLQPGIRALTAATSTQIGEGGLKSPRGPIESTPRPESPLSSLNAGFRRPRPVSAAAGAHAVGGGPGVRTGIVLALLLILHAVAQAKPDAPRLVDVRTVAPSIHVDLQYAKKENTFGKRLYGGSVALLREPVATRLARAQVRLWGAGYSLKIWDAYRPRSVQWTMWRIRPNPRYLTRPWVGSKHSRGAAVDVTLVTRAGRAVPMPTAHDEFSPRAHRGAVRGVAAPARRNAAFLDRVMREAGFRPNRWEWWHFEAPDWRQYPLADVLVPNDSPFPGPRSRIPSP